MIIHTRNREIEIALGLGWFTIFYSSPKRGLYAVYPDSGGNPGPRRIEKDENEDGSKQYWVGRKRTLHIVYDPPCAAEAMERWREETKDLDYEEVCRLAIERSKAREASQAAQA